MKENSVYWKGAATTINENMQNEDKYEKMLVNFSEFHDSLDTLFHYRGIKFVSIMFLLLIWV